MSGDWSELTRTLIRSALQEDLAQEGDITAALVDTGRSVAACLVPRQRGVIAGLRLLPTILEAFNESQRQSVSSASSQIEDGDRVEAGRAVAELRGERAAVLAVERTVLNFLGRMSGVATLTRAYVDAARAVNPDVEVTDTRKTIPGWRELDKYAVRCGGGTNHRAGLYDAILIKDNHLAGVATERLGATLFEMLNRAAELPVKPKFVEVEVDDLGQLEQVCRVLGVDMVLLDNFSTVDLRGAVAMRDSLGLRGELGLEASGGVTLETIGEIAGSGVDRISVGALTHSAAALDIGLDFQA